MHSSYANTSRGTDSLNRTEINKTNLSTFVSRNSSFERNNHQQISIIILNQLSPHDHTTMIYLIILEPITRSRMSVRAALTFVPLDVLDDIAHGFSETKMVQPRTELLVLPTLSFNHSG